MARDSDLRTVLDIISRRSRKAQTTVMDRFCNVLIICFGPRVSPLLFKGKAVEITSLVAFFCGSFPRTLGCKPFQHSNSVVASVFLIFSYLHYGRR